MSFKLAWLIKDLTNSAISLVYNEPFGHIGMSRYEVTKIVYFEIDED